MFSLVVGFWFSSLSKRKRLSVSRSLSHQFAAQHSTAHTINRTHDVYDSLQSQFVLSCLIVLFDFRFPYVSWFPAIVCPHAANDLGTLHTSPLFICSWSDLGCGVIWGVWVDGVKDGWASLVDLLSFFFSRDGAESWWTEKNEMEKERHIHARRRDLVGPCMDGLFFLDFDGNRWAS